MYHHLYTEPPRPSARRRELPAGFDAVVGRAMAKDPSQRYATAGQLADAAQQALPDRTPSGSLPPRPPDRDQVTRLATGPPPDPPPGQRNPAQAPPFQPPAPPHPRSKLPLILGIAGVVIVLAVATAILFAVLSADGAIVDEPISVGAEPNDVEVGEGFVWTANRSSDTISRVNPSDATSQEIKVDGEPISLEADRGAVWVWNYSDAITRVDARTGEVSQPITGGSPDFPITGIAVGGGYVWLSHAANGTVTRINMQTQALEGDPIAVGPKPLAMVFGDKLLYVVNSGDSTISTLNGPTGEVLGTPLKINQDLTNCSACLDIYDGVIYIATTDGVTPIDERYFIIGEPIPLKGYSHYTVGGGSLWVAYPLDNVIRRIDLSNRQLHGEPIEGIGRGVGEVAFADDGLWVSDATQNTVTRIRPGP
jgi:streptogramin lyase